MFSDHSLSLCSFILGLDFLCMLISFPITGRFLPHSWERWPLAAPAYVVQSIFSVPPAEISLKECRLGLFGSQVHPWSNHDSREFLTLLNRPKYCSPLLPPPNPRGMEWNQTCGWCLTQVPSTLANAPILQMISVLTDNPQLHSVWDLPLVT